MTWCEIGNSMITTDGMIDSCPIQLSETLKCNDVPFLTYAKIHVNKKKT